MNDHASTMTEVVVVGASGFGRESLDVLVAMIEVGSPIQILGVVDDFPISENLKRLQNRGINYLGTVQSFIEKRQLHVRYVLGIGSPRIREMIVKKLESTGFSPIAAIHPTAIFGTQTEYSEGIVVCAGATISTNVKLGRHVHLNPRVVIGHDSILEDFVSVNPAAVISGEVLVKKNTLVGAAATILQGLTIGEGATVGAAACVTKQVDNGAIVKGIPAR